MFEDIRKPAGLFAIVAALSVLSAGCIAQDRPHEGGFFVVADAGQNKVIAVGETAHFEWAEDHALKAEAGEPPHVDVEYEWMVDGVVSSHNHTLSVTRTQPDFALVELNVTAKETTASDGAGVLFVPGPANSSRQLYVATVGPMGAWPQIPGVLPQPPFISRDDKGFWNSVALSAVMAPVRVMILLPDPSFPPDPIHAALLFAVKDGPSPARGVATGPLEFDAENTYALWIDPTTAGQDMMEIRGTDGALISNTTLVAFEAAHPADEEVEVVVPEAQQGLPGFEGLAAVATMVVLGAVLVAARRRL